MRFFAFESKKQSKTAIDKLSSEQIACIDVFVRSRGLGEWGRQQLIELEAMSERERQHWIRSLDRESLTWPAPVSKALRQRLGRSLGEQAKIEAQEKGWLGRLGMGDWMHKKNSVGLWVLLAGVVVLQVAFAVQRSGASMGVLLVVLLASAVMVWANNQRSLASVGTVGMRHDILLEWAGWFADVEKERLSKGHNELTLFERWLAAQEAQRERQELEQALRVSGSGGIAELTRRGLSRMGFGKMITNVSPSGSSHGQRAEQDSGQTDRGMGNHDVYAEAPALKKGPRRL